MPSNAMISATDSSNPPVWSPDDRPALSLTPYADAFLASEIEEARLEWINAVCRIPARSGTKRTNALKKANALQQRYEDLCGHPVGKPDRKLPMDALPHREIKKS